MALTSDTMQAIMNYAQAMREADARKRAALAAAVVPNMARRGITVPSPAPEAPLLPMEMSAEVAPGYWPGKMPQASTSPIMAGINPEVPLPINTSNVPVSGANMTPAKPQGTFNKIMSALADPRVGAYLTNLGAGLGAQRMPGQSEMQVIAQGLRQGYGGMLNENQRQQQVQIANKQLEMAEREQARKEAETASGTAAETRRTGAYERQVEGSIKQGEASITQRQSELEAEKNWRKRAADIEQARVDQDWKKHEALMKQQEAELGLANRKMTLAEAEGKREAELQPLRVHVAKLQAEHQILAAKAELARLQQTAEHGGNKEESENFRAAIQLLGDRYRNMTIDEKFDPKKMQEFLKQNDASKVAEEVRTVRKALGGTSKVSASQETPPAGAVGKALVGGKWQYKLANGTVVDSKGNKVQ